MILTLKSCFSAVSTAIAASKGAFFSISQALHTEHKRNLRTSDFQTFFDTRSRDPRGAPSVTASYSAFTLTRFGKSAAAAAAAAAA